MKTHLITSVAAVAMLSLPGCTQDNDAAETVQSAVESVVTPELDGRAMAAELLNSDYTAPANADFSTDAFTALASQIPGETNFSFSSVSEGENGAAIVNDFAFTVMVDGIELGIKAETAEFWGFDGDALTGQIEGTNLDQTAKLADRITLTGISSVGFDELGERIASEYNDALATTIGPSGEIISPADMMVIRDYDIRAEKLVLDGLTLDPYEVTFTQDEDIDPDNIDGVHLLQAYAAMSRAFSLNGFALSNTEFVMDMAAAEQGMSINMTIPVTVMSDYKRGDMGYLAYFDNTFDMDGAFPVEGAGFEDSTMKLDMEGGVKTYEISDIRLSNVYRAVSDWKMPEHTETDFMSLGQWRIEDYSTNMGDRTVFNADLIALDLREFHWLLPTKINLDVDGFAYEIGTLFEGIFEMMPEEDMSAEELARIQNVMSVLGDNGLDCLCGDLEINAAWNEETGAIQYAETGNFADLFGGKTEFDMTIITPAQAAAAIGDEIDETEFEEQFMDVYEFRSLLWQIEDTGGLNALATVAHEIGKAFPDEPSMAMLAYSDAEALRNLAVNAVRGFGPSLTQEAPEARPWVDAVANWLEGGGTLTFKSDPPAPVNADLIESYGDADPEPSEIIEVLGLSVTHTPAN
ncbi:MAG: hypothetical protein AAGI14_00280 [Pseudomonadota bacterium]